MRLRRFALTVWALSATLLVSVSAWSQEERSAETIRVRTRVVSLDVIVKNKRTGMPVTNLLRNNFEVLDEGKPRVLSYFATRGERDQRPLAFALVLDLRPGGAGRYLRQPGPLTSLASALTKLSSEDEVALMVVSSKDGGYKNELLASFTRDRGKITTLISQVPDLISTRPLPGDGNLREVIPEISQLIAKQRPDSQGVVLYISDGLNIMLTSERNENVIALARSNIRLFALLCHQLDVVKAGMVSFTPLFALGGLSIHNLEYFANQTGGETLSVQKPEDYSKGVDAILGDLIGRYSLGFTLNEKESNDGRLHRLKIRVKGRDSQGKTLSLRVFAPGSYYLPSGR